MADDVHVKADFVHVKPDNATADEIVALNVHHIVATIFVPGTAKLTVRMIVGPEIHVSGDSAKAVLKAIGARPDYKFEAAVY